MQHRFIRGARKTSYLTELIERYQDYRTRAPGRAPQYYQATVRNSGAWDGTMRSEWDFNTVRTTSAMGSLRSMAKDIMPPGMVLDEEYEDEHGDDESMFDTGTINTTAATTKGSDVPLLPPQPGVNVNALGMNAQASHSTVVIRSLAKGSPDGAPSLMTDNGSDETAGGGPTGDGGSSGPVTPSTSVESVGAQVQVVDG